jgi:hypothetical protein
MPAEIFRVRPQDIPPVYPIRLPSRLFYVLIACENRPPGWHHGPFTAGFCRRTGGKYPARFTVRIRDGQGDLAAQAKKVLYICRKTE